MAATGAERQATYKARQLKEGGGERLDLIVDSDTKQALTRLTKCYRVTQRDMLIHLIGVADQATKAALGEDATRYVQGKALLNLESYTAVVSPIRSNLQPDDQPVVITLINPAFQSST